jgi:hypothetical protein
MAVGIGHHAHMTDPSRPLDADELDILDFLLQADVPGAAQLREQVAGARVVGGCDRPCPPAAARKYLVRVIDAATGEFLRELVLDPTRDSSPPANHPAPPLKSDSPDPRIVGPGYADVLRHHRAEGVGFEPTRSYEPLAVFKTAAIGH